MLDTALLELPKFTGNCHLCTQQQAQLRKQHNKQSGQIPILPVRVADLIGHMRDKHDTSINTAYVTRTCIFCGIVLTSVHEFVRHLYLQHRIIMFSSISKVFWVDRGSKATSTLAPSSNNSQPLVSSCIAVALPPKASTFAAAAKTSTRRPPSVLSVSPVNSSFSLSVRKLHELSSTPISEDGWLSINFNRFV